MPFARDFEDLECWKHSRLLTKSVYHVTNSKIFDRDWAFRNQIRRASISIMNNIAEGFGRSSRKEFIRFLEFANGSTNEVKSMLYMMEDLDYLDDQKVADLKVKADNTRNLILGFIKYLRRVEIKK